VRCHLFRSGELCAPRMRLPAWTAIVGLL
jgi:hypothetical protein